MKEQLYISSFCSIRGNRVNINHSITFSEKSETAEEFLRAVYKHYQLSYSKFFKMDNLCRLGFLASELLLHERKISSVYQPEDISIVTSNRSSSLDTDLAHQAAIGDRENYFPSPSIFVYTLPNIVNGEIAIRNTIKGENSFFIFDKFDADFMHSYTSALFDEGKTVCCVAGWIEFYRGTFDAFLYTVEKEPGVLGIEYTSENLNKLYN